MTGLSFMGGALAVDHGVEEAVLTIIGVTLVPLGHLLNMRRRVTPGAGRRLDLVQISVAEPRKNPQHCPYIWAVDALYPGHRRHTHS